MNAGNNQIWSHKLPKSTCRKHTYVSPVRLRNFYIQTYFQLLENWNDEEVELTTFPFHSYILLDLTHYTHLACNFSGEALDTMRYASSFSLRSLLQGLSLLYYLDQILVSRSMHLRLDILFCLGSKYA